MIDVRARRAERMTRLAMLIAAVAFAWTATAFAGGTTQERRHRFQLDRRRGQYDFIRRGLGPGSLPYTRQGHWGTGLRYSKYPLFHGPVPAGAGADCLYETGLFPWQRG